MRLWCIISQWALTFWTLLTLRFTVVGRRPQGTLLGWFASAGSLARMVFPIMSGYVANYQGVHFLFFILVTVLVLSTVFTFAARKTLSMLSM